MGSLLLRGAALLALAASTIAAPTAARASVINFATFSGNNGDALTSYAQNGFTVTKTAGSPEFVTGIGNPAPSIYIPPSLPVGAVTITSAGQSFTFSSADLESDSPVTTDFNNYAITGYLGTAVVFSQSGRVFGVPGYSFATIAASKPSALIDSLVISVQGGLNAPYGALLDNIVVEPATVPEPSSLALLTSLVLGLGAARRRKKP